jgi:hypothetical protein
MRILTFVLIPTYDAHIHYCSEVGRTGSVKRRTGRPGFDYGQGQDFSFLQNAQTGSVAHPSYLLGAGVSFFGGKAAEV